MDEVFPVVAGVVVGLVVYRLPPTLRSIALGILGVVLGVAVSWVSGELSVSIWYVFFDIGQVWLAGALTIVLVRAWRSRVLRAS